MIADPAKAAQEIFAAMQATNATRTAQLQANGCLGRAA